MISFQCKGRVVPPKHFPIAAWISLQTLNGGALQHPPFLLSQLKNLCTAVWSSRFQPRLRLAGMHTHILDVQSIDAMTETMMKLEQLVHIDAKRAVI